MYFNVIKSREIHLPASCCGFDSQISETFKICTTYLTLIGPGECGLLYAVMCILSVVVHQSCRGRTTTPNEPQRLNNNDKQYV